MPIGGRRRPTWRAWAVVAALLLLSALLLPDVMAQVGGPTEEGPPPSGAPHETADTDTPPPSPEDGAIAEEPAPPSDSELPVTVARVSGDDRFATAGILSTFFDAGGTVFVASGEGFADALAGGPVAALEDAPMLLVSQSEVPDDTREALDLLAPSSIVVLGGSGVVSDVVVDELSTWAPVDRVAGANRYETAAALAERGFADGAFGVIVATGRSFPDALSGATRGSASLDRMPILLVEPTSVPAATRDAIERLQPGTILVLGGDGVVSESVADELRELAPDVERIAGSDRYETSALVADSYDSATTVLFLATGSNFPDALAAAPVIGYFDGPTILVPPSGDLPRGTAAAIRRFSGVESVVAVGGTGALSDDVIDQVNVVLNQGGDQ